MSWVDIVLLGAIWASGICVGYLIKDWIEENKEDIMWWNTEYKIRDPWPYRAKDFWFKHVWCPIFGHKRRVKFSGTIPCDRHD